MVKLTEHMVREARQTWKETEISKVEAVPEVQKWKILNKLTDPGQSIAVQQVRVGGKYVFHDADILVEMEKEHLIIHYAPADLKCAGDNLQVLIDEAKLESMEGAGNNEITHEEVRHTFQICSNTPGPDGVTACMIDMTQRDLMTDYLFRLWNKVWTSSVIPNKWKLEHQVLLPKPGKDSYNECNAYRTISITDILGKCLEKIVSTGLVCELERSQFDEGQFAYLKQRSSTQAVLSLAETVKSNMLNGELTAVLFFDFSDAFGSVNRLKLIEKLRLHLGISDKLLLYLINFLSGQMAHIKVNDLIGEWLDSEYGTSGGTVLGPFCFCVTFMIRPHVSSESLLMILSTSQLQVM